MNSEINIYEFSRAFDNVHYSDTYQKWVSGGYAAEKINNFNKLVPSEIKKAVASRNFSLNDNYPPIDGEVALIGFEVNNYSLLAVANGQIDDGGRPTIGYRYFWLERDINDTEIDGLGTLLFWWGSQLEKPQFDMEKARFHEAPTVFITNDIVTKERFKIEFETTVTNITMERLAPYLTVVNKSNSSFENSSDYIYCHYISYYLAIGSDCNLAWAWNVRRLIHPENFLSIYSSTEADKPTVSRTEITNVTGETQQQRVKKFQQDLPIEECLKDIENRFTSQRNLEDTGKLNELFEYLCNPCGLKKNKRLYDNSHKYRAILALLIPEETKIWLEEFLNYSNLEDPNVQISLRLHKQLFQLSYKHNAEAYEFLYNLVSENISDLLVKLTTQRDKQKSEKMSELLSNSWELPFHRYAEELQEFLRTFMQSEEIIKTPDKFHNYALSTVQEIKTKLRNQEQFPVVERFEEVIKLFKKNEFSELAFVFTFFSTRKTNNNSPEWLRTFANAQTVKVGTQNNYHRHSGLFRMFVTLPVRFITSIIFFPGKILTGKTLRNAKGYIANQENDIKIINRINGNLKFPFSLWLGVIFILLGIGIILFLRYNYSLIILSIVILIIGIILLHSHFV